MGQQIRVYLNAQDEEVSESGEYKGLRVDKDKGLFYTKEFDFGDDIPDELLEHIAFVSVYETFVIRSTRVTGIYSDETKFGDATGELDLVVSRDGGRSHYLLKVRGTKFDQVCKLYRAIRAGTIRPSESWEDKQGGMSRQELEEELESTKRELLGLAYSDQHTTEQLNHALDSLREVKDVANGWWDPNYQKKLRRIIDEVLDHVSLVKHE